MTTMTTGEGAKMASRQVVFKITPELLHTLLMLPDDVKVTGMSQDVLFDCGAYALRAESESFPVTGEGYRLPEANPIYSQENGKPVFLGWSGLNQPVADTPIFITGGDS